MQKSSRHLAFYLSGAVLFALVAILLVISGITPPHYKRSFSPEDFGSERLGFQLVTYREIPGWRQDEMAPALEAFLRSCDVLEKRDANEPVNVFENAERGVPEFFGGLGADWRPPCSEARSLVKLNHVDPGSRRGSIRGFFEYHFLPVQVFIRRDPLPGGPARNEQPSLTEEGLFTGYFEPVYDAARNQNAIADAVPVYPYPDDLVDVDLGAFRPDLKGDRIAGRLEGARLVPYPDRRAINEGALADVQPIGWMDPNDLFFLQIQGSGQLQFAQGGSRRISYAGQNGHPYTAIGKVMVDRGIMPLEQVTMQSIRTWLDNANPQAAQELREQNASYVFFTDLGAPTNDLGPPGAQGVALTPGRSLAVDRRYYPLGAPVWVDIEPIEGLGRERFQRLMIAQDTGGAIRGPVRGDVFWGAGAQASDIAGGMKTRGRFYLLLPRATVERLLSTE